MTDKIFPAVGGSILLQGSQRDSCACFFKLPIWCVFNFNLSWILELLVFWGLPLLLEIAFYINSLLFVSSTDKRFKRTIFLLHYLMPLWTSFVSQPVWRMSECCNPRLLRKHQEIRILAFSSEIQISISFFAWPGMPMCDYPNRCKHIDFDLCADTQFLEEIFQLSLLTLISVAMAWRASVWFGLLNLSCSEIV